MGFNGFSGVFITNKNGDDKAWLFDIGRIVHL